ncbi:hypothetical protein ACFUJ0_06215 [Streptomyces sp. NPDC057242]
MITALIIAGAALAWGLGCLALRAVLALDDTLTDQPTGRHR